MRAYRVDPERRGLPETGIPIRALDGEEWVTADIVELDAASMRDFLRSHKRWGEEVVFILLGYDRSVLRD